MQTDDRERMCPLKKNTAGRCPVALRLALMQQMAGKVCATGLGVQSGLQWVPMTMPLTSLYVITHILALRLSEALHLAGYPGNLPRPQTRVNPT